MLFEAVDVAGIKQLPIRLVQDRVGCSARCIDAVSSNGQDTLSRITEAQHHHIKQ